MSQRYTLTLTEEQVRVVDRALDVLSRLHAGQFEVILGDVMSFNPVPDEEDAKTNYYWRREQLSQYLRSCEPYLTGLPPNTHHSIGSKDLGEAARVAYDIIKVIRFVQHQETGQPRFSVYRHPPEPMSQEPLPMFAAVPAPALSEGERQETMLSDDVPELQAEVQRLRDCARAQADRICRLEVVDGSIIITAPFGTEETELAIGAAFVELYHGLEKTGEALLAEQAQGSENLT